MKLYRDIKTDQFGKNPCALYVKEEFVMDKDGNLVVDKTTADGRPLSYKIKQTPISANEFITLFIKEKVKDGMAPAYEELLIADGVSAKNKKLVQEAIAEQKSRLHRADRTNISKTPAVSDNSEALNKDRKAVPIRAPY